MNQELRTANGDILSDDQIAKVILEVIAESEAYGIMDIVTHLPGLIADLKPILVKYAVSCVIMENNDSFLFQDFLCYGKMIGKKRTFIAPILTLFLLDHYHGLVFVNLGEGGCHLGPHQRQHVAHYQGTKTKKPIKKLFSCAVTGASIYLSFKKYEISFSFKLILFPFIPD